MNERLGLRVLRIIGERNLTQKVVAKRMGIRQQYISQLINNKVGDPRLSTLERLRDALDCSWEELLGTYDPLEHMKANE